MDSTAVLALLLQGCVFLLPSLFHSAGTRCKNSLQIWASWRISASLLTVPFPWDANSRMWGDEVFFPVAQLVLAAPLFIMVMASQQKHMSSSQGGSPVIPPEQISSLSTAQRCFLLSFDCFMLATERVDEVWVSGGGSGYLKCSPALVSAFLSCLKELFCVFVLPQIPFWGFCLFNVNQACDYSWDSCSADGQSCYYEKIHRYSVAYN